MKTVKRISGGCHGIYFQLNQFRGFKTLQHSYRKPRFYKTKITALASVTAEKLKKEYETHLKAYRLAPSVVCQPFGVKAYRLQGGWVVGLELEHLGKTPFFNSKTNPEKLDRMRDEMTQVLQQAGVFHQDLHDANIMVHKRQLKVIDFDKRFVRFRKRA